MVFNPQIFMLLGVGAARRVASLSDAPPAPLHSMVVTVLYYQCRNFLNIAVVAGLLWNLVLGHGHGFALPFYMESLAVMLGSAFGPIVLFLGGAANVGALKELSVLRSALMPLLTVLLKVFFLPTFVAAVTSWLGGKSQTVNFAFTFSTLPSAASTLVFARPYEPSEDMNSLMNASLLLHKVVGFPVLFLAAAVLTTTSAHQTRRAVVKFENDLSLLCVGLTLILLLSRTWFTGWAKPPLQKIYVLLLITFLESTVTSGVSFLLGYVPGASLSWCNAALFSFASFFRWTADLAIVICAYKTYGEARDRLRIYRQASLRITPIACAAHVASDLSAPLIDERKATPSPYMLGWLEVAAAVATGLMMTMPWLLSMPCPPAERLDSLQPLVVPYPNSLQPLVYALAYAASALAQFTWSGMMIAADTNATKMIGGRKSLKLMRLRRTHSFLIRFECFLFLAGTRLVLACATNARLYSTSWSTQLRSAEAGQHSTHLSGSLEMMLLVASLIGHSRGLFLFFLFGVSEGVFTKPSLLCARAFSRIGGFGMGPASNLRMSVKDSAGSTGYETVDPKEREVHNSQAATQIIRAARRKSLVEEQYSQAASHNIRVTRRKSLG